MASKSKRIAALVLASMMATAALAGCSGGDEEEETVIPVQQSSSGAAEKVDLSNPETIQFIKDTMAKEAAAHGNKIDLKMWCSGDDRLFEKKLVEEFQEQFKDSRYTIDIKIVAKGEGDAGGAVIESPKKAADVFSFADDQLSPMLKAGALAEVAPYYANNVKDENSADSITVSSESGKLYAFPKTSDNGYFLYYDKRIFGDDVGSMDDMIQKAAAANKNVYYNITNAWYETGFFFTAGCTIKYENGKQTATFGTPEGLSAAKAMCHIAESEGKGYSGSPGQIGDNAYVEQGFREGTLAAAVIGTWMGPAIKTAIGVENVGAAKLPTVLMDGEQKQLHSFGGYKLIGVNIFSNFPFTSQTFAYFLGSEQSQIKRYNERGLIPTNVKAGEDETIRKDPAFKAIEDQRPYSHPQGASVGGVYWGAGVDSIGSNIVTAKGKLTDDELNTKLKSVEENMKL